jgi:hypothetical protein
MSLLSPLFFIGLSYYSQKRLRKSLFASISLVLFGSQVAVGQDRFGTWVVSQRIPSPANPLFGSGASSIWGMKTVLGRADHQYAYYGNWKESAIDVNVSNYVTLTIPPVGGFPVVGAIKKAANGHEALVYSFRRFDPNAVGQQKYVAPTRIVGRVSAKASGDVSGPNGDLVQSQSTIKLLSKFHGGIDSNSDEGTPQISETITATSARTLSISGFEVGFPNGFAVGFAVNWVSNQFAAANQSGEDRVVISTKGVSSEDVSVTVSTYVTAEVDISDPTGIPNNAYGWATSTAISNTTFVPGAWQNGPGQPWNIPGLIPRPRAPFTPGPRMTAPPPDTSDTDRSIQFNSDRSMSIGTIRVEPYPEE